jgi:hypothetical protein
MSTLNGSFGDVHARVLRQHAEIRARLRGLDAGAVHACSPHAGIHLRVSLFRLAVLLESHLQYEEMELAPLIRELDAWGPAREAAMLAEHAEQRTRLEHACFLAESEATGDLELGREVSEVVVSLLDDMAREERELSDLAGLAAGTPLEQMTG